MILTWIMFAVALSLSAVAAFYSIVGLAAIFAAAVWPIVIMGTILEIAKLTVTVWLHEYWRHCKLIMKLYLVPAVVVLMIITSMGIFGFLSKAHIDQVIPTGDKTAQLALFDERIANERAIIDNSRSLIRQMDDTVNGIIEKGESREIKLRDGRIIVRSPAELALQVRRSQAADRDRLTRTIEESQAKIVAIQEERAPIAKEIRGLEAEVGPIKYIAALIYGDNPDTNLLERAVRWMIIVLVAVFDPLAIMMLLAATESRKWYLETKKKDIPDDALVPTEPPDVGAPDTNPPRDSDPELDAVQPDVPPVVAPRPAYLDQGGFGFKQLDPVVAPGPEHQKIQPKKTPESVPYTVLDDDSLQDDPPPQATPNTAQPEIQEQVDTDVGAQHNDMLNDVVNTEQDINAAIQDQKNQLVRRAKRLWKHDNPTLTLKEQRKLLEAGLLDTEPWMTYLDDPRLQTVCGFGRTLPSSADKGDMFILTSSMPTQLFKFNGTKWIQSDKDQTEQYIENNDYIDYLIEQIGSGSYDADLLNEAESRAVTQKLNQDLSDRT